MMVPVGRLIVLKTVAKSELVTAMSYLTVPAVLGPVVGPPVGGFIVTYYSWRWIFFINVPIGMIGITLVTWYIPNIREDKIFPLDFRGFLLTGLGLAGMVIGFESIGRGVVPASIIMCVMAAGGVCMALYILHARRIDYPIIDLELMKIPTFRAGYARRRTVPDGHRRVAVPAGDAAADGFRPLAVRFRDADLHQRRRRHVDEDDRATDHPPPGLSHGADRQRRI